jgi:acyl-CoA hydrolase
VKVGKPELFNALHSCVERILEHCDGHVVLATPLGLGKPNRLINALYRKVATDPTCQLTIHTALSLDLPSAKGDLERRFIAPFVERQFGSDYPRLDYVAAMRASSLPPNIRVHEFYFQSGAMLQSAQAQRDYVSLNYTHVARDLLSSGVNVVVQLVAQRGEGDAARYSLASNPDLTFDLLDLLERHGKARPFVVGVVHPDLPFLGGDAEVDASFFGGLVQATDAEQKLFATPRDNVGNVEYAIGLHASTLVRDGGTLQIGIGALSDALVHALLMRDQHNDVYQATLQALNDGEVPAALSDIGGLQAFSQGLNGSSEMVMDGFMHLRQAGILKRRVYPDLALQRALNQGLIGEFLRAGDAKKLRACGVLPSKLQAADLPRLICLGILPNGVVIDEHALSWPEGYRVGLNLDEDYVLSGLDHLIEGRRLLGGSYLQGGFFLGSQQLYDWLGSLKGDDFNGLQMNRISSINRLKRGEEPLAAAQRRDARFFNTCMIASVLGAAASDALHDGRVVSGVGGQYNFVAMAHDLDDARSILMLRSTRREHGRVVSNIRWNYGHTTIPRHLRDIYVTEYGVADLLGKSDEECIVAMLSICDARFHEELVAEAMRARKLPADFRIPDAWSANKPSALSARLREPRRQGLLPDFPFGSDFDAIELRLLPALGWLKKATGSAKAWPQLLAALISPGENDVEAISRMRLQAPASMRERVMARLLRGALARTSGSRRSA